MTEYHNWVHDDWSEPPMFDATLVISPIPAYRMWSDHPGQNLRSLNFPYYWDHGINHAKCELVGSPFHCYPAVPDDNCECGFYGLKSLDHLIDTFYTMEPHPPGSWPRPTVLGRVEFSGNVVVGEWGYRAEKAKITGFISLGTICADSSRREVTTSRLDELANQYGVPVEQFV